jgi:hypothetical protein
MPDHFLPEQWREFLDFSSFEPVRDNKPLHMIAHAHPGILRRETEMLCNQHDAGDKPVTESACHSGVLAIADKKRIAWMLKS